MLFRGLYSLNEGQIGSEDFDRYQSFDHSYLFASKQDLKNNLYETYYFNFISAISRHRLEDLATSALQYNSVSQINKVCIYLSQWFDLNLIVNKDFEATLC